MFFTRRNNQNRQRRGTRPGRRWLAEITRLAPAVECLEDRRLLSAGSLARFSDFGSLKINFDSYSKDRVLVQISSEASQEQIADLFETWGDNELNPVTQLTEGLFQVYVGGSDSVEAVVESYRGKDGVAMAELDYVIELSVLQEPNDTAFSSLWGLDNTGQTGGTFDADIDALEAWETTTGSSDVVVAVIDTGIDYTHVDLAANMWSNAGEIAGNGVDDDGNGYVDDVYGYDFYNDDGDPYDDHSHGTHVAGTIAGVGNNGTGVIGVAPNVKLMALKFLGGNGSGYTSDAVQALDYAVSMGAQISNNSWGGGGFSSALYASLQNARNAGHIFVAAAGNSASNNDASPHYPSNYDLDNVISVAATDHNDELAWFSSYGATTVDLAAPGAGIYSTTPGNNYATFSGTSMATPHVSGVVALVMSQHPEWSYDQIINQVLSTTDSISSLNGVIETGGRLNAASALGNPAPIVDRHGDSAAEATLITAWDSTDGNIGSDIDTDWFQLNVLAGKDYEFDVSLGSLTDSTLTLYDQDGTTELAFDDNSGTGNGSHIDWSATTDQTVYLKVAGATSADLGSYSILATHEDDHGNTYLEATAATLGTNDGVIEHGGDVDFFSFQVTAGETYTIETTLASLADSRIDVYDENGNWLTYNDDSSTSFASRLLWTAGYTGTAHVAVSAYSTTQTGSYQLHLGTPTMVSMDGTVGDEIEVSGDADFFGLHVDEGYTYVFETTLGTLPDSWIDLYDAGGNWVWFDDDGGDGLASRLQWTATYTGNAFIGVEGYWHDDTGTYDLAVSQIVQSPTAISPLNGSETTIDPTFVWSAEPGAASYDFWLFDATLGQMAHTNFDVLTNTYNAPFTLEVDHQYLWWVRAEAPSGYVSAGTSQQNFTAVNQAPVLDAIGDQSMPHNVDSLSVELSATDSDGHSLVYTIEVLDEAASLHAFNVDQAYGLNVHENAAENDYWLNARGRDERYLMGYFILPSGALYRWGGSIAGSTYLTTVDSRYYDDPSLLANATLQDLSGVTTGLAGSTLSIDPADGYTGTFRVRVSVGDGYDTVSRSFHVTVVNNTPILDPVDDQSFSYTTDSITLGFSATDADGDPLTYSVEVNGDPLAQKAYDLDQQYNLDLIPGSEAYNYWYNYRGAGEKYLADGFFVLPDGSLYKWGSSIAASTYIDTLDGSYHDDLTLLTEAQPPSSASVSASIDGSDLTIDPADGYTGSFQVTLSATDGLETAQQTFTVSVTNDAPVLTAIDDQAFSHTTDSVTLGLAATDADGDPLTYSVEVNGDPLAQKAYNLDQQYNLDLIPGSEDYNYWYNYRGAGEKYLAGGFFVLPDGSLYKWGSSIANSTYLDTLDGSYHADLTLLTEANSPSSASVNAVINGTDLTIDPASGYAGSFQVTVSVSDGVHVTQHSFQVNVTNNTPVLGSIGDQAMAAGDDYLNVNLAASDGDGDPLNYTVEIGADAVTARAYDLDQLYGLDVISGSEDTNYWYDYRGAGEKYLAGGYFLLPDGSLYKWGWSIASSTRIATLDATYHADPTLLTEAQLPSDTNVLATLNGSTLTLDPDAAYRGRFQVTVSVGDGVDVVQETFLVHREQAGGSSLMKTTAIRSNEGSTADVSSSNSTDPEPRQSGTASLAGLVSQATAGAHVEAKSFETFDEPVAERLDLNSNTQPASTQSQPAGSVDDTSSTGDLDSFLESLPGLDSVSEISKSDDADLSDDDGDDLDQALDRIFSEADAIEADSLLDDLMVV